MQQKFVGVSEVIGWFHFSEVFEHVLDLRLLRTTSSDNLSLDACWKLANMT